MELFLKRSRGSITVLVTLLLVPTIFFTSFLVDLARLKLYGNQAVMTADNYGEAVLAQYDNLLKELYGLFAVTQDEKAVKALDELQEYIKTSFNPSKNTVSWEHLQSVPGLGNSIYEGFMPYAAAAVSLETNWVENANLRNEAVFATQIGDFMRFRIAQQLWDDGSELLEALSQIQNMEGNARAIEKKLEIDKEAEDIFEAAREFYLTLKEFTRYPDYIRSINAAYSNCKSSFLRLTDTTAVTSYKIYYDYETADADAMTAAVEKRDRIEAAETEEENNGAGEAPEGGTGETSDGGTSESEMASEEQETLTEEEQKLVDIYDAWMEDENARREKLEEKFDSAIDGIRNYADNRAGTYPVVFTNFYSKLQELERRAENVKRKSRNLESLKAQQQEILEDENVSDKLKTGMEQELERMQKLFDELEYYTDIVTFIGGYSGVNDGYREQVSDITERLEQIRDAYLDCKNENEMPDWFAPLNESEWKDFRADHDYKEKLYQELDHCFGEDGEEEEGKKKKKEADALLKEASDSLKEKEESSARDIPESFGYGKNGQCRGFDLMKMAKEAVAMFSFNGLKNAANKLVLKLYLTEYDFGMFTNRMTNSKKSEEEGSSQKTELSLTGYEKAANINYLYQAELEYLLGGYNSSDENLGEARNKILAFRATVNFTATYTIDEINQLIQAISDGAAIVNPILGLLVNGALRLAVAGVETAADWQKLKDGESVVVLKTKLDHLTSYDKIKGLLGIDKEQGEDEKSFQMDYEQYLLVALLFLSSFEDLAQRTANLIELNVNAVQQKIGSDGILSERKFKMEEAHTAVDATCTVHLDFVVIPSGFAKAVAAADDYDRLTQAEKNSYKFTVTRGY